MAAKPPGGGTPPRAPTAPRAPTPPRAPTLPGVAAPAAPRVAQVPVAPPTPKVSVEEAAALASAARPRPPSTPDDWEATDVTRPHDMMLSRDDVRTIVDQAIAAPLAALRQGQDDMRSRFAELEERLAILERSQLTPIAPPVRAVAAASPPPLPVAPIPVAVAIAVPTPVQVVVPVAVAKAPTSNPFGSVVAAARPATMDVDLSPDEILFDGAKRRRRITVVVLLLLLITVGTFVGIAMTSQMRSGH